jgi:hypothetical protein
MNGKQKQRSYPLNNLTHEKIYSVFYLIIKSLQATRNVYIVFFK